MTSFRDVVQALFWKIFALDLAHFFWQKYNIHIASYHCFFCHYKTFDTENKTKTSCRNIVSFPAIVSRGRHSFSNLFSEYSTFRTAVYVAVDLKNKVHAVPTYYYRVSLFENTLFVSSLFNFI